MEMNQHAYSRIGESDDHHGPVRSISDDCCHVVIRPYTCAFCNRGFSNAQALGGHMNIHRKDRAKLKLQALAAASASAEEQDLEKMTVDRVLDDRKSTPDDEDLFFLESHQHKIGNIIPDHKRPSSAQDHATSTSGKDGEEEEEEEEEEEKMQLSLTRSLSVPELDLELRLGTAGLPAG